MDSAFLTLILIPLLFSPPSQSSFTVIRIVVGFTEWAVNPPQYPTNIGIMEEEVKNGLKKISSINSVLG